MRFDAVLFDLDGTLVDSAPDLAGAANELRVLDGLGPLPEEDYRAWAGSGARGMLWVAFGLQPADADYPQRRDAFLGLYQRRLLQASRVFAAVPQMLTRIEAAGSPWGVVTNKALYLAEPLLTGLALRHRAAVLVGGDSTPHTKPHPAPLLHAADRLGLDARRCVYVGDDARDVQAGRAAGMATVAAAWGYLGTGSRVQDWDATTVVESPADLLKWLGLP